jgi:hypothetical protein
MRAIERLRSALRNQKSAPTNEAFPSNFSYINGSREPLVIGAKLILYETNERTVQLQISGDGSSATITDTVNSNDLAKAPHVTNHIWYPPMPGREGNFSRIKHPENGGESLLDRQIVPGHVEMDESLTTINKNPHEKIVYEIT